MYTVKCSVECVVCTQKIKNIVELFGIGACEENFLITILQFWKWVYTSVGILFDFVKWIILEERVCMYITCHKNTKIQFQLITILHLERICWQGWFEKSYWWLNHQPNVHFYGYWRVTIHIFWVLQNLLLLLISDNLYWPVTLHRSL